MKTDPRLLLNHYSVMKHREKMKTERIKFRAQYDETIWRPAIAKSAERIMSGIFEGQYEPFQTEPSLDKHTNDLIETIEETFTKNEDLLFSRTAEMETVLRLLGELMAEKSGADYWRWARIHKLIHENHILVQSWMVSLPTESIQRNEEKIAELPSYDHPLELVDTWGYYRHKQYWAGFHEALEVEKEKAANAWHFVRNSLFPNNEFRLKPIIEFKSTLLYRYSKTVWLDWVNDLPFLHMKEAALDRIMNLDEMIELLAYSLKQNYEEFSALLVWKYFELIKQITVNLEQYVDENWAINFEEEEIVKRNKEELEKWNQQELPERIRSIADLLFQCDEQVGIRLVISILQQISVRGINKDRIHSIVREDFIEGLTKNPAIEVQTILNKPVTEGALLSAALFFFEKGNISSDETIPSLWDAYLELLKQERFYWDTNLKEQEDDFLLLWLMGGVLSEFSNPEIVLEEAVRSLNAETEGWKFQTGTFYALNRKVVHMLIIGAMAADWLHQNQKQENAQRLFSFVFQEANQRIRLLMEHDHEEFNPLIIQVWTRLMMIFPDKYVQMAYDAANDMDNLDHILLSLTILRQNVQHDGTKILDPQLVHLMKSKFDSKFPIIKMKYAHLPHQIKWYESFGWWEE